MHKMGVRRDKNCKACQQQDKCSLAHGEFTHCPRMNMITGNDTEKLFFFEWEMEKTFFFQHN